MKISLIFQKESPWENGYNESFNGKLRDDLFNIEIFHTPKECPDIDKSYGDKNIILFAHTAH